MKPDKFEIEVESKTDSLPVINEFINGNLINFQADAATIYKVQLAVDEACTNIINYAYPGTIGHIKINLELAGEDILVTIRDKGQPFDPLSVPLADVSLDVEQRQIGGLGIFLVRNMMDSVSYTFDPEEGNKLSLRKKRSSRTSAN